MSVASDRELAIDAAPLALVSLAIVTLAEHPRVMGAIVLAAIVLRLSLFRLLVARSRRAMRVELAFFGICTAVGALNDYNTVVVHGVYGYSVPAELPALSSIPIWMLATWGLVLRFVATLSRWHRIGGGAPVSDRVWPLRAPSAPARIVVIALLVAGTRAITYTHASDPLWSWIPYVVALAIAALVLSPTRRDRALVAIALVVGPLVEAAYIQLGGLHRYPLGWFFGVPLWIVLWWALGAWLWADLSARVHRALDR